MNYVDGNGYAKTTVTVYSGLAEWEDPFKGDDDFVYNPKRRPTKKDYTNWAVWGKLQKTASILYPEGAAFYEHYRSNKGSCYIYDYEKAYSQDIKIKNAVKKALKELKRKAPSFKVKNDTWYYVYTSLVFVKPISMNWLLALGGHHFGIAAEVAYDSKNKFYVMRYCILAIDRYNFDGDGKKFFGISDALNGRFVTLGWAKFFTSYGITGGGTIWKG